jgi:hypothetical protein
MDYKFYERKLNDVILKCPIEAGVEILVYNVFDSIIESEDLSLVDINRLRKNRDKRLTTDAGVSDIAVLSKDFKYKTNIGKVYGFIEVKAANNPLYETAQVDGQKKGISHFLYTNGLVWKYFKNGKSKWEVSLAYLETGECRSVGDFRPISIDKVRFNILKEEINKINWTI